MLPARKYRTLTYMKVIGIVAEYNPLHNGHVYQIEYAKNELGADAIVVVLGNNFLQRGLPAITDSHTRARLAIEAGADIVFEMPQVVSCNSANEYALGSIALLHHCSIVTDFLFGCENGDAAQFETAASVIDKYEGKKTFSDAILSYRGQGLSFAQARAKAIVDMDDSLSEEFLSSPNNILGIEYVRALHHFNSKITPYALPRIGALHGDMKTDGTYASATKIRQMILNKEDITKFVPNNTNAYFKNDDAVILEPDDFSILLQDRLYLSDNFEWAMDCSEDFSNKIRNTRDSFINYTDYANALKSKDMDLSRIQRVLTQILLNLNKTHREQLHEVDYKTYLHLLGFSKQGSEFLGKIKKESQLPMFTSPQDAKSYLTTKEQQNLYALDLQAANSYRTVATQKYQRCYPTEFTRKFS
jgi:predicted nucleotidyltransferase